MLYILTLKKKSHTRTECIIPLHESASSHPERTLTLLQTGPCSHESVFSTGQGSVEMVVFRISARSAFYIHERCVSSFCILILSDSFLLTYSRRCWSAERISKNVICLPAPLFSSKHYYGYIWASFYVVRSSPCTYTVYVYLFAFMDTPSKLSMT